MRWSSRRTRRPARIGIGWSTRRTCRRTGTASPAACRCSTTRTSPLASCCRRSRCRAVLPQRRGGRDAASSTTGDGHARRRSSDRSTTAPATTSSSRSARRGGCEPVRSDDQRMLCLESPSAIVPPKRYRNEYGQLLEHSPYCERDIRPPAAGAEPATTGDFVIEVRARPDHRLPLPPPPARRGRLGRPPVPVRLQHRGFRADHRARPPAAAGASDVPAANFVICSFVPRKFDYHPLAIPGALQPLEHQQRRGHLLRRRQLHVAPRDEESSVFTLHPAGFRMGRIRARPRRRSARRRPRSWR